MSLQCWCLFHRKVMVEESFWHRGFHLLPATYFVSKMLKLWIVFFYIVLFLRLCGILLVKFLISFGVYDMPLHLYLSISTLRLSSQLTNLHCAAVIDVIWHARNQAIFSCQLLGLLDLLVLLFLKLIWYKMELCRSVFMNSSKIFRGSNRAILKHPRW